MEITTTNKEEILKVSEVILTALKTHLPKELHDEKLETAHSDIISLYSKAEQNKVTSIELV